jgi:hypothetical protein
MKIFREIKQPSLKIIMKTFILSCVAAAALCSITGCGTEETTPTTTTTQTSTPAPEPITTTTTTSTNTP